jgi:hypothetical protein
MGNTAFLLLLFLAFLPSGTSGQERADTSRVTVVGVVLDRHTRQALPNAVVQFPVLDLTFLSDTTGRFTLSDFQRGTYRMVVSKPGYTPSEGDFRVERAGTFELLLTATTPSNPTAQSKVIGWVTDKTTTRPIESAVVSIPSMNLRRMTDRRGWFDLGEIPGGTYQLGVESLGYESLVDSILVRGGEALEVRIPLATEPIELEGITVVAHSRFLESTGFFRRQGKGYNGRQWTAEEIAAEDPVLVEDLVTQVLGVRRGQTWGGRKAIIGRGGCVLRLFVDGFQMDDFDIDHIDPRNIQALEIWHGNEAEMPVEYGSLHIPKQCGVILVWLKH